MDAHLQNNETVKTGDEAAHISTLIEILEQVMKDLKAEQKEAKGRIEASKAKRRLKGDRQDKEDCSDVIGHGSSEENATESTEESSGESSCEIHCTNDTESSEERAGEGNRDGKGSWPEHRRMYREIQR